MVSVLAVYILEVQNNFMDAEKVRSIRLPEKVWDALDADAERCRRSSQKQIEALLVTFYEMESVEIDKRQLEFVGELLPKSKTKIPVIEMDKSKKKKVG